jgi:hypothetical protein
MVLEREVKAWVKDRNQCGVRIDWQFSIRLARKKFVNKYPKIIFLSDAAISIVQKML